MNKQYQAKHVMTPHAVAVRETDPAIQALGLMTQFGIRHLPVMKDDQVIGLISESDIRMGMAVYGKTKVALGTDLKVGEISQKNPYSVDLQTPVKEIAAHMADRHISSALVFDDKKLAGIITTVDICRLLSQIL